MECDKESTSKKKIVPNSVDYGFFQGISLLDLKDNEIR